MATLKFSIQQGFNWIKESVNLFKASPRRWILLALSYVVIFIMLPSIPSFQWFALLTILIWPIFIAIAVTLLRNTDQNREQDINKVFESIKFKLPQLISIGIAAMVYIILLTIILSSDIQSLVGATGDTAKLTESQMLDMLNKMLTLLLKLLLLSAPLMMATWFSPMLIAFNNYTVVKAIKSSIAGSLQYMISLGVAWLILTAGVALLMLIVGLLGGLLAWIDSQIAEVVMTLVIFVCFLIATALMLTFQYISYKDIFRLAPSNQP